MSGDLEKTPEQIALGVRIDRANLYRKYDYAISRLWERGSRLPLEDKIRLAEEAVEAGIDLRDMGIISDEELRSAKTSLAGFRSEAALFASILSDASQNS